MFGQQGVSIAFPIGLVIPGRPFVSPAAFTQVAEARCMVVLEQPQSISEITFFLTDALPEGLGAIMHFSVAPFMNWEILGAIGPGKPSGVFRTGFSLREDMASQSVVQIGISFEPLTTLENLNIATIGVEDRLSIATKVAQDLWNYMTSFADSSKPGHMLVPTTAFDSWMSRFERKSKIDPNFFLK